MNIEEVREYCLSLPYATEDIPFGKQGYDDDVAFRVGGKIFAFLCMDGSNLVVLKCDPERALDLRDCYIGAIEPAFHWNKKYWNQVHFDNPLLSDKFIKELIDHSFSEVVKKMTNKQRTLLGL